MSAAERMRAYHALLRCAPLSRVGHKPDGAYSMRHLPIGHNERLRAKLLAFLHAVRSGGAPAVTGDEGVARLEIAIRCLETSAKTVAAPSLRKGPRRVVG